MQLPEPTLPIDVECTSSGYAFWLKRGERQTVDEMTFVGDEAPEQIRELVKGERYRYVSRTPDSVILSRLDSPERVLVFRETFKMMLLNGYFALHD